MNTVRSSVSSVLNKINIIVTNIMKMIDKINNNIIIIIIIIIIITTTIILIKSLLPTVC